MFNMARPLLKEQLGGIESSGLYKDERVIESPQEAVIEVEGGREVLNMCSNNYLGLSSDPRVIDAARQALDKWGYGLSSVRFICGTQEIHKELERSVSDFLRTEDTILYSSCFDANGGLFETLLNDEDMVISDELNHASVIDGIRLCKAERKRYGHSDMNELEEILRKAQDKRLRLIATDGVFSMDGDMARLDDICDLAEKYGAMVMIDDSHATGFVGESGRGAHEFFHVMERVDIITSTFGKALGGASGGFASGRKEIIELLRQRSRPYLFSNTLAPMIVAGSIKAIELIRESDKPRQRLISNTKRFRNGISELGFQIKEGDHPIVPIMLGEADKAKQMARDLYERGVYLVGFSYPVVPMGQARVRVQLSAAHSDQDLDYALEQFRQIAR